MKVPLFDRAILLLICSNETFGIGGAPPPGGGCCREEQPWARALFNSDAFKKLVSDREAGSNFFAFVVEGRQITQRPHGEINRSLIFKRLCLAYSASDNDCDALAHGVVGRIVKAA